MHAGKDRPQPRFILCVARQGTVEPFCWITFSDEHFARFSSDTKADTRIIECVYDPNWITVEYNPDDYAERTWDNPRQSPGGWRFERVREDKNLPNDRSTVDSIFNSVRDGVTAPELLRALGINPSSALGAFNVNGPGGGGGGAHAPPKPTMQQNTVREAPPPAAELS